MSRPAKSAKSQSGQPPSDGHPSRDPSRLGVQTTSLAAAGLWPPPGFSARQSAGLCSARVLPTSRLFPFLSRGREVMCVLDPAGFAPWQAYTKGLDRCGRRPSLNLRQARLFLPSPGRHRQPKWGCGLAHQAASPQASNRVALRQRPRPLLWSSARCAARNLPRMQVQRVTWGWPPSCSERLKVELGHPLRGEVFSKLQKFSKCLQNDARRGGGCIPLRSGHCSVAMARKRWATPSRRGREELSGVRGGGCGCIDHSSSSVSVGG